MLWYSVCPSFEQVIRRNNAIVHPHLQSKIQKSSKIVVETTCQPVLEDHGSRWLECKHCFLLATPVAKSFTFAWLLWKDKFAEHFLINRSHEPDMPTNFFACYFRCELFWSLNASCFLVLSSFWLTWVWRMRTLFRTLEEVYLGISKFLKRMQL